MLRLPYDSIDVYLLRTEATGLNEVLQTCRDARKAISGMYTMLGRSRW